MSAWVTWAGGAIEMEARVIMPCQGPLAGGEEPLERLRRRVLAALDEPHGPVSGKGREIGTEPRERRWPGAERKARR